MRSAGGLRLVVERLTLGVQKPRQWVPQVERYYCWRMGRRDYLVLWKPWTGLMVLSSVPVGSAGTKGIIQFPNLERRKMKRIVSDEGDAAILPALSSDSVTFKKFPRLCEFLTATKYDDDSPRAPGRLWLDNDGIAFTCTLFEVSAFRRVRLRGATLDDALMLAEKHLGMESAPWEIDSYARDKAAGKKKK